MTEIGPASIEPTPENIRTWLLERVAHYLNEPAETIDLGVPLAEYGLDSVYAFALCGEIEDAMYVTVEPTLIWDVENLADLIARIVKLTADDPARA